jgi:hypothetical protein
MNAGFANWNWPDIESVLETLLGDGTGPTVCGGQAVGYWAQRYGLGAVVSRDLDLIGDRDDARAAASILGATVRYPDRYDMTVLTAVLHTVWQGRPLMIEWLSSVPGIETDPEATSVLVEYRKHRLCRILHPLSLVMAKLHAVRFFDPEGRQDEAHLRTMMEAARLWLAEVAETDGPRALRLVHQWHRMTRQSGYRKVLHRLDLDWTTLIPLEVLGRRSTEDTLIARFLKDHWPRLQQD